MAKNTAITMRINEQTKSDAENIFSSLGMTLSEAINVFLHKSIMEGGLPFDVRQPRFNQTTEKAMEEANRIISGAEDAPQFASAHDLMQELDK